MLLVAFALSSVMFVACNKYDEEINGLQSQIDQLNATVQSLQSAISNGAVVTSVAETAEGIKVTLSNNQSYVIKHGTNGKDGVNGANGADGKNGSVVTIGENGNWFIDGVDTGKAAQGPKGDAGVAGAAGKDADQIHYYPCTDKESENYGKWVKVTNGVEEATTESWMHEGVLTAVFDSANGVLVVVGVEGATDGRVEIATGAHLASLAFVPEVMTENLGMPILSSYYISQYAGLDKDKAEVWSKVASNKLEMVYRVNPTNAVLANTSFSFIDRTVKTKVDGDSTNLLNFVGYKAVEGGIEVTATANEINYEGNQDNEYNLFALKAVNEKDGSEIVSDYAKFEYNNLQWFRLACGEYNEKGEFVRNNSHTQWINNPADAEDYNTFYSLTKITDYTKVENIAAIDEAWDMYYINKHNPNHFAGTFVYTESIDLDDLFQLQTSTNNGWKAVADLNFDVEYKFSMVEKFLGTDGVTDQQTFVEFDEATNVVTVKSSLPSKRSAIGRTPAFKVEAYANGVLVADMYFKVKVLEAKAKEPITLWVNGGVIEYTDIVSLAAATAKKPATEVALTWDRVNAEIYEVLGLSATQFNDKYNATVSHIVVENKKGVEYGGTPAGVAAYQYLADNDYGSTNTESAGASIFFDPTALQLGKDTVFVTYNSNDELSYGDVKIAFTYDIVHEKAFPALNTDYKVADNTINVGTLNSKGKVEYSAATLETVQTKGKLVNGKWVLSNTIKEFIADYAEGLKLPGNHTALTFDLKGVVYADTLREASVNPLVKLNKKVYDVTNGYGATLSGNTLDSELALYDALYAAEDSRVYVVTMTITMANGGECTKDFAVKFVRPFTMTVGAVELKTMAAPSTADLAKLVTVKDFAGQLLYGKFTKDKKDYYTVTEYATKYYGLTADDFKFAYDVDDKGFGENTLTVNAEGVITWDNMGGDLQVNKSAKSVVTLTLEGLAVTKAEGDVTVLSTANSME